MMAAVEKEGIIVARKERKADQFAATCVPRRLIHRWKLYVLNIKEERYRVFRRSRLRDAAKEILSNSKLHVY